VLKQLVRVSLAHPKLVVLASVLLVAYGCVLLTGAEFEVFPEFVPAQATIQVEAPGMVAEQVELLVTRPVELAISGATGVASVRSESIQGLAVINVVFRSGEDPYRARQVVAERLAEVGGTLPAGVAAPTLSALTSSTMDLLKIGLLSDRMSPMELRDLAQWTVRPRLLAAPGVARAVLYGGEQRRLEVRVRNEDLIARDLTLGDVIASVQAATRIRGGGFIDTEAQRILVEPRGTAVDADALASAVIAPAGAGAVGTGTVRVRDVADVAYAQTPPFGDALIMGKPGVLVSLASQYGANTLSATRAVEAALDDLRPVFEARGVTLYPALHRPANFIETALSGISGDLLIGAILITVVLLTFTRSLRIALIAFVSIPVSLLAALITLDLLHQTVNTMVLGGLAVALGVVIDDAVIGTENIVRRLRERGGRPAFDVVLGATMEVRAPVVYATWVLALTMTPVVFLTGLQGAFFSPLAWSFLLATVASLLVAVTLTPALSLLFLRNTEPPPEPRFLVAAKRMHEVLLRPLCRHPLLALLVTSFLGLAALAGLASFGAELLPAFRERHYVLQVTGPSGASLDWMSRTGQRISADLLAIPGIATVEQQIGRASASEDPFPPNRSEFHVELKAVDGKTEDRILKQIRETLRGYPEIQSEALTFLGDRIGESLSGETAAIAISIFGPDLDGLDRAAAAIAAKVRQVPGTTDVQIKTVPGAPTLIIEPLAAVMAVRDVSLADIQTAVETAYQGQKVAQVVDGEKVVDVAVRLAPPYSEDPEAAGRITVRASGGALVPLSDVARVYLGGTRSEILHDGGRRRQVVTANSQIADITGLTRRVQKAIADDVHLPEGIYLEYSGAAEGQAKAQRELLINVALSLVGIVVLLVLAFGGGRPAILILSSAPSALAGGALAIALGGGVLSLGALVGFVTLFGIVARNSILLVSHADYLVEREGYDWSLATVLRATRERFSPILMTALVTSLGMVPLAMASGEAGREVQGPMATVILAGLATSTLLSLFLLPPLILAYRHREAHGAAQDEPSAGQ
jgi:CzcA family heavy metal efflux pump